MADFSATDAALEGFRLTREKPRVVLIWAALMLVAGLVSSGLIVALAGNALNALLAASSTGSDPEAVLASARELGPFYAVLLPLAVLFYAVIYGAVYRAILRPGEGGPGYLKFGGDELRLAGVLLMLLLLFVGLTVGLTVVLGLLVAALSAGGGTGGAVAGGVMLPFLLLGGLAFFGVKLSLAMPATFAERRIVLFRSWSLTKGRFWPLLGAYVLSIILSVVVYLLAIMIYLAIAALVGGGIAGATSVFRPDYSSLITLFSTAMVVYVLISALVSAVTTAITAAPPAAAYRDITGYGRDTAEVFS